MFCWYLNPPVLPYCIFQVTMAHRKPAPRPPCDLLACRKWIIFICNICRVTVLSLRGSVSALLKLSILLPLHTPVAWAPALYTYTHTHSCAHTCTLHTEISCSTRTCLLASLIQIQYMYFVCIFAFWKTTCELK